jgi:glycosyltransferase involved in cell wall biosynthesis
MKRTKWAIITGEYPPQIGGVSHYTQLVAQGLVEVGDAVHVFAPSCGDVQTRDGKVVLRRLPGCFGSRALALLSQELERLAPDRLLVQYVPHAFGFKAMNVPFCWWLRRQSQRLPVWTMFHEIEFAFHWRQPLKHNFLSVVTHLMAFLTSRASARIFVSTTYFEKTLRRYASAPTPISWLPVPSNMPTCVSPRAIEETRKKIAANKETIIIGHFSTLGTRHAPMLERILPSVLASDERYIALLIGEGGAQFTRKVLDVHPNLHDRIKPLGVLSSEDVVTNLAACDLLLQPYPDGISSRRTTIMAGIALGLPVVSNLGIATEAIWRECRAVELVRDLDAREYAEVIRRLMNDKKRRLELSARARETYRRYFDIAQTISKIKENDV